MQSDPNQPPALPQQQSYPPAGPYSPTAPGQQGWQPAPPPPPPYTPLPGQQIWQGGPPQPPRKKSRKKLWIILAVIFVVFVIIGAIGNSGKTPATTDAPPTQVATSQAQSQPTQAAATPTAIPTPKPSFATFSDGTWQVGKDIKAGTYRTRVGSTGCYYARLKGFGGSVDDILSNDNTDDPAIVTISASDKGFQSQSCGTWTKDLSRITASKTTWPDGMYFVGTDITAGTYKSSGQTGCYYARLKGFSGGLDDILANNNTDTPAIVTIATSDKGFESRGCGTWTKM